LQTESWEKMGGGKSVPVNQKTSLILSICTRTVPLKYSFRLHINYVTHRTILLADHKKNNCASNVSYRPWGAFPLKSGVIIFYFIWRSTHIQKLRVLSS